MLGQIIPAESWFFSLIFARISIIIIMIPFIGQGFVTPQIRILLALLISFLLLPVLSPSLPAMPASTAETVKIIAAEFVVAFTMGTVIRFTIDSLTYAGAFMAFMSGLSNAALFNPLQSEQSVLPSAFLNLAGTTLLFSTQFHHIFFLAIAGSYTVFPPGIFFQTGDFTTLVITMMSKSFATGIQMAIPFFVIQTVFMILLGIMARLMPQFSVFFVALPLQILIGFSILAVVFSSIMMVFLEHFQESLLPFTTIAGG